MIKKIIIASIIILWCCSAIAQEREVTEKQTPAIEKSSSESKQDDSECEFKLESCGLIVTCKDLPTNVSWDNSMMKYCPKGWRLTKIRDVQN
jgi:hypothetical protein